MLQSTLIKYESAIANKPIENAIVITKSENIRQCLGNPNEVYPDVNLGKNMGLVTGGICVTNEEKAQKEYEAVLQWVLAEEDRVEERLKRAGKLLKGLDTNQEDFAYIYEERNRRIKEIKEKYNI